MIDRSLLNLDVLCETPHELCVAVRSFSPDLVVEVCEMQRGDLPGLTGFVHHQCQCDGIRAARDRHENGHVSRRAEKVTDIRR